MSKGIELEEEEVEPHTRYMYENKFNMHRLPSYLTHKMEKKTKRGPMDIFLNSNKVKAGHVVNDNVVINVNNNLVNEMEVEPELIEDKEEEHDDVVGGGRE